MPLFQLKINMNLLLLPPSPSLTPSLPPSLAASLPPLPPLCPPLTVQLSVTVNPAQLVVNASEMAVLTCVAQAYPLPSILWSREASGYSLVFLDGVVEKEVGQWHHFWDWTVCKGKEKYIISIPLPPSPPSPLSLQKY